MDGNDRSEEVTWQPGPEGRWGSSGHANRSSRAREKASRQRGGQGRAPWPKYRQCPGQEGRDALMSPNPILEAGGRLQRFKADVRYSLIEIFKESLGENLHDLEMVMSL